MRFHPWKWIAGGFLASAIAATDGKYRVFSVGEIQQRERKLLPRDVLVMAIGVWTDQEIAFRGSGEEAALITLKSETRSARLS